MRALSNPGESPQTVRELYSDPVRANSREVAFGDRWHHPGQGPWKLIWIEDTGELVLVGLNWEERSGAGGAAAEGMSDLVFGAAFDLVLRKFTRRGRPAQVLIIAVEPDQSTVESRLEGWEPRQMEDSGIDWLLSRLSPRDGGA